MSLALSTAWLAWKKWRSFDVIKAPLVQPVFVYFFGSAQPYSINFGLLNGFHNKECLSKMGGMAQRLRSRFPPSCPWFDSRRSQILSGQFLEILDVEEVYCRRHLESVDRGLIMLIVPFKYYKRVLKRVHVLLSLLDKILIGDDVIDTSSNQPKIKIIPFFSQRKNFLELFIESRNGFFCCIIRPKA